MEVDGGDNKETHQWHYFPEVRLPLLPKDEIHVHHVETLRTSEEALSHLASI